MESRQLEAEMLARCATVVRQEAPLVVQDQREANVFRLASMVAHSRFPSEAALLMAAAEEYFATHPHERLDPAEAIRRGWIISLPRLRDFLSRQLRLRANP